MAELFVPARFNGPRQSGNGGYSAGLVAGLLGGVASVSLRSPVPLDSPLQVIADEDDSVRVLAGETLIAEAERAIGFELDVPEPVGLDDARRASAGYRGLEGGPFSRCFVCGLEREDSLSVFAGEVEGRRVVASAWEPPEWTADARGEVPPEVVWAVLDCPTYFAAFLGDELAISFLVRMTARVERAPRVGEAHVVMAWPIEVDGRKRLAGSAVLSVDGDVLAVAEVLLLEPRQN